MPSLARYQKWGSSSSDNGIPNLHQYLRCHIDWTFGSGGATTIFFMSRIRRNII